MANNENKLKEYTDLIFKTLGKGTDVFVKDINKIIIEKFSTGSYKLDDDMKGGYPKGSLVELYGPPGSGKTTACIHAVTEHQKKYPDEPVLWVDLEKVFDPVYFTAVGIDISPDKFVLVRPTAGEDAWETIIGFVKIFEKGIIILDSVALLLPKKEDEGMVGDAQMASAARMNSQGLRKLFPYMKPGGTTVFAINQMRKNIGGYGDPNVTTGGEAWSFYARTRLKLSTSKGESGEYALHKFHQVKSNYGHKDRITETTILYGQGFDKMKELLDIAVEQDVVKKAGSWYSFGEMKLGQGADSVVDLMNDNPELVSEIENKLTK
jgi:recombination protein RecA